MNGDAFLDCPPDEDRITSYDLAHLRLYLQLLDIEAEGVLDWRQAAAAVFSIDPAAEKTRARHLYDAHLHRARWMTEQGYRQLAAFERFDSRSS
ncbi:MAG: DUF2285 domain-containing protein [Sphingobium limneticum]